MVINTESNILMFQFENVKWQYSPDKAQQKKKEQEEDREENSLVEVLSRSSTQVSSLKDSLSSQQTVTQESLLSKPRRSRVFRRATRLPTGKRTESQATSVYPMEWMRGWQDEFLCRERTSIQVGEGQRGRETQNPKRVPGSELSAQSPTRGSNSQTVRS